MIDGTIVPHIIFGAGRVLAPLKKSQTGLFFHNSLVFSVFVDLRGDMFKDCVEEDA